MTDDLIMWLRDQIAADIQRWRPVLAGARLNGKATAREHLARCEAHTAVLDLHVHERPYPDTAPDDIGCRACDVSGLDGSLDTAPNAWCGTVRAVSLAYRYRPGYRAGWTP